MNSSSRAMRPRGLSHRISARGKFTAQSLQEKRLSLPVGMLNDRDKINRPRSQSSRLACARMQGYVRRCWHLGPRPTPSGSTGLARSTASSNSWSHPSFTRQRRPRNRNHSDKPQKTCGPGCKAAKPQSRKALCLKVKIFPELHPVPSSDRLFLGSHCMRCGPHLRYIHKWRRTWTSGRRFGWKKPHQVMRHGFLFLTKRILRSECLARTLRRKKRTWQRSRITCFLLWRD